MTLSKKLFGVTAMVAALGTLLVSAQLSSATHVRPKGATPLYVPLVVAYKQCTAPNSSHGAPLAFQSCVPPTQESNFLTVGTPDANGSAANMSGFIRLVVKSTSPEDVLITSSLTDVRCKPGSGISASVCAPGNTDTAGLDYTGQLQGNAMIRITDHFNGPTAFTSAGTVTDIGFPVTSNCVASAGTTIGATCSIATSANSVVPGSVPDGKRGNVEVQTLQVNDGGSSGIAGAADATRAFTQGIFIP
jgi:hypothetical protein